MKELKISWWFLAASLCLLFSGCTSLSKEACFGGNWQGIGHDDGSRGRLYSRLVGHEQACLKHDISHDEDAYMQGWHEGVQIYCAVRNRGQETARNRGQTTVTTK